MSIGLAVAVSVVLIVVNGFFVGVELAYVASRRTRLDSLAEEGAFGAGSAARAVRAITRQLFAAQLGITVCTVILGLIAEDALAKIIEPAIEAVVELPESVLHNIGFVVALAVVTFVHTVFGEMVPKNLAISAPETSARRMAPIHTAVVAAVGPIIWVLRQLARPLLRLFGVDPDSIGRAHTPEELVRLIERSAERGLVDEHEHALLSGALEFGDTRVRSVMIPVADVVSVTRRATVAEVEHLVVAHGLSRIPVRADDGRTFLGFVHAKDLVRLEGDVAEEPIPLEVIRRVPAIAVDRTLEDVMLLMRRTRKHLAPVMANGVVVGLVTLEDVLEELVGEIYDESD